MNPCVTPWHSYSIYYPMPLLYLYLIYLLSVFVYSSIFIIVDYQYFIVNRPVKNAYFSNMSYNFANKKSTEQ